MYEDDFITSTIKRVDGYLAGERTDAIRSISDLPADEQAWFDACIEEDNLAWDEYWQKHCQLHGSELAEGGGCAECEAEEADERRNDL